MNSLMKELEGKDTDTLRGMRIKFKNWGWDKNAELVAEELSIWNELDSSSELSEDSGLTHAAELKR